MKVRTAHGDEIDLQPCPLCDGVKLYAGPQSVMSVGVQCLTCGCSVARNIPGARWPRGCRKAGDVEAMMACARRVTLQAAADAWNTRPDPLPFLRHLVDTVWSTAFEDTSVPSTEWAGRMIEAARASFRRRRKKMPRF